MSAAICLLSSCSRPLASSQSQSCVIQSQPVPPPRRSAVADDLPDCRLIGCRLSPRPYHALSSSPCFCAALYWALHVLVCTTVHPLPVPKRLARGKDESLVDLVLLIPPQDPTSGRAPLGPPPRRTWGGEVCSPALCWNGKHLPIGGNLKAQVSNAAADAATGSMFGSTEILLRLAMLLFHTSALRLST